MPRFRLETALKVRERLEKLYQKALAEQVQIQQQLRDQKKILETDLETHRRDLNTARHNGFTITQLRMSDQFCERLTYKMEKIKSQLREQKDVIELKRQELTRATQKKRVLEILKKNQTQRFQDEMERHERQEADEIAQGLKRRQENS